MDERLERAIELVNPPCSLTIVEAAEELGVRRKYLDALSAKHGVSLAKMRKAARQSVVERTLDGEISAQEGAALLRVSSREVMHAIARMRAEREKERRAESPLGMYCPACEAMRPKSATGKCGKSIVERNSHFGSCSVKGRCDARLITFGE